MGPKIGVMEFVEGCIPSGKFDWAKNLPAGEAHSEIRRMKFLCSMAGTIFFSVFSFFLKEKRERKKK